MHRERAEGRERGRGSKEKKNRGGKGTKELPGTAVIGFCFIDCRDSSDWSFFY
jgi:hypothetical protein